jgi:predicted DNA-binding antitoxin AbrB/MazE fold protein
LAVKIRAHYDGKTFVPDEPVDLKVGEPVEVERIERKLNAAEIRRRRAALRRFAARAVSGLSIPDEALRRENMYEDRL